MKFKCLWRDTSKYFTRASRNCLLSWTSKALFSQQQMRQGQFGRRSLGLIRYQKSRYSSHQHPHIPIVNQLELWQPLLIYYLCLILCMLQLVSYRKICWQMITFKGTSMLKKPVPKCRVINQDEAEDPDDVPLQWLEKQSVFPWGLWVCVK